jgi:hypothetical protein
MFEVTRDRSFCLSMLQWDKVLDWEFRTPRIMWFEGGKLNVRKSFDVIVVIHRGG